MNHKLWTAVGARVLAVSFVLAGLTACGDRLSHVSSSKAPATAADPSAVVIGTAPAQPSGDPPGTTPVANSTSELTKSEEIAKKPQEGDDSSFSSVAPDSKQKAGGQDPQAQPDTKKD